MASPEELYGQKITMKRSTPATVNTATSMTEYEDFGDDAGKGLENASRSEMLTPFLAVLHYQCPQIDESNPSTFIDGARPGMLFNTATRQVSNGKDGIEILPVAREVVWTEWVPRDEGGGFRGTRSGHDPLISKLRTEQGGFKRLITPEGTELVEQFNLYLLYNPGEGPLTMDNAQEAVLAFTSTKIAGYKKFFTLAKAIMYPTSKGTVNPPLWAHRWRLRTLPQKNDQGAFFVYELNLVNPTPSLTRPVNSLVSVGSDLYQRAKSFNELLSQGNVIANYDAATEQQQQDDGIPF